MTVFQNISRGLIPARLTVAEVYALTDQGVLREGDAFELVEGEIVPMAAAKASPHEMMKSRLLMHLSRTVPNGMGVFVEPSVGVSETSLLEPDIAVWPRDIGCREVTGDQIALIIEVSSSSIGYDLRQKAPLYARGGVREYWVVDALRYTIRVHRAPGPDGYRDVAEYESHDLVASLMPGVAVRLDDLGLPPPQTVLGY